VHAIAGTAPGVKTVDTSSPGQQELAGKEGICPVTQNETA